MSDLTLTDAVAWWGAIVATLVLGWDVYKWMRSGPNIKVRATPNMNVFPKLPPTGDLTFIFVSATNHGDQLTTITHLAGIHYSSLFSKLLRRGGQHFAVVNNVLGAQMPHLLGPGAQWTGAINQDDAVAKFGTSGRLYCGVFHSLSKKAV